MKTEFWKYEGAGNDFIMIDNRGGGFNANPELVAGLCDRRFGIGADGLILLENAEGVDFSMRYFNSNGPEATMCGNGGRCIVLFARHLGVAGEETEFKAIDGRHSAQIAQETGDSGTVSLGMADVSMVQRVGNGFRVNTGSPHYVEFVNDVDSIDVASRGRELRHDKMFAPGGVNVNFVQPMPDGTLRLRTYERGVEDETLACGTGAVASVLASAEEFYPDAGSREIAVRGGVLMVSYARRDGGFTNIILTGPARRVFGGIIETENFRNIASHLKS